MTGGSGRGWLRRAAVLLSGAALVTCGPEAGSGSAPGEAPTLVLPPPPVSTSIALEPQADEEVLSDAGGGLEFDPVSGRLIIPEAGPPPPKPLRSDAKLPTDQMLRDEQVGVTLQAAFVHRALPRVADGPEVNAAGIAAAVKLTEPNVGVLVTAMGRMKVVFESRALPLPFRSEVRARFDRYGHLVFWPSSPRYRVVPPGALRTVLGERRVDVTPLSAGQKMNAGTGTRLEQSVRTVELAGSLGRIRLELATFPEAGLGGPLLCRMLVETIGIDPATSECKPEEIPLFASIDWQEGHGIDFNVKGFERRADLPPGEALVPPPAAEKTDALLPDTSDGVYLTQEELSAFRTQATPPPILDPAAPPEGLVADNGRNQLMVLWIDGVATVAVPPLSKRFIVGPKPGRYVVQWRTFLGDRIDEARVVELPAIVRSVAAASTADAGP